MLEFKNVIVKLSSGDMTKPFSLVLNRGEVACICSSSIWGKTKLLHSVLGMAPSDGGYITIDGEQVVPAAADYFRQMIAYVPYQLPDVPMLVSELCDMVFGIKVNASAKLNREALRPIWQGMGIDQSWFDENITELTTTQLQLVMISMLPLLKRPIVLIDNAPQTPMVGQLMHDLASNGAEVLYTCEDNMIASDKIINF